MNHNLSPRHNSFSFSETAKQAAALLKQEFPEYVAVVNQAQKEKTEIEFSLATFPGDANLLFVCLWYAYDQGITVYLLPKQIKKGSKTKT